MKTGFLIWFLTASAWVLIGPCVTYAQPQYENTWAQARSSGKGSLLVYWYESNPFITRKDGKMSGIEYELMEGFKTFLKERHNVDLQITWKEAQSFGDAYRSARDSKKPGVFATSAFSITPRRLKAAGFSPPYMSDISVLITSNEIPIVKTIDEFNRTFSKLKAITIEGTTYEEDVFKIKKQGDLNFPIQYIPSSENILRVVEETDSSFGFIDLPVYMMIFNNDPSVKVKRQNFFSTKREGYAFVHPLGSDWSEPIAEYFTDKKFQPALDKIVSKYLDLDLYRFMEALASQSNDQIALLTKEKEIQSKDLAGKMEQIARETRTKNFLIALIIFILLSFFLIIVLYRKLHEQKDKIDAQRESIELKSQQVEKRNEHLLALDEEKNNLIKILAHDMRTPISHVQGLAQVFLLNNDALPEEQKFFIREINEASTRLNKMITHILDVDALENDRVKIFMEDVSIFPLLKQVVKSFEKTASRKNIEISFIADAEDAVIRGESLFLIQIFENLISNALKFSDAGKKVFVLLRDSSESIAIHICDQGPGLTTEDLDKLFKKFQRLSARPTAGESSIGLGLSIVQKYVELMNGRVWCESEPGKGATFIVEFSKILYAQN